MRSGTPIPAAWICPSSVGTDDSPTGWRRHRSSDAFAPANTRTAATSRSPLAGCQALRSGTPLAEVDEAARSVIDGAGRAEQFVHGLGHGVGLEVHEAPALPRAGDGTLAAGMAVTVEPGVYVPGRGGVRIEDT